MITEIAQIEIKPWRSEGSGAAAAAARNRFLRCKGWKELELHRRIEKPSCATGGCRHGGSEKPYRRFPKVPNFRWK